MSSIDEQTLHGIGMTSMRTRERLVKRLQDSGIENNEVLNLIRATPRHLFIDEALAHRAYEDTALPIGFNQTISQPYIVARMTEALLANGPLQRVLEIGTGSGYQTAILAQAVKKVFSVERIQGLQVKAKKRIQLLKLKNVRFRHTDGGVGWEEEGPFDGILAAAAPMHVPAALLEQLAIGGRLVMPVGDEHTQMLHVVTRTEGGYDTKKLEAVKFVPFLSGAI